MPKPHTSPNKAKGFFDKKDFRYIPEDDEYQCPAKQRAIKRFTRVEHNQTITRYWSSACPRCPLKDRCTDGDYRVFRAGNTNRFSNPRRIASIKCPMRCGCEDTVEHAFGTLKAWMGATHFLTKTLPKVKTEMSLHVRRIT